MSKHTTIRCDGCGFASDDDERWHEASVNSKTYDLCNSCFERAILDAVASKLVAPSKKPPYPAPDHPIAPLSDFNARNLGAPAK